MWLRNLSFIFLNESKLKYFQLEINMDKPQKKKKSKISQSKEDKFCMSPFNWVI